MRSLHSRILVGAASTTMVASGFVGLATSGPVAAASGSQLPSQINIYAMQDETGAAGIVGVDDANALKLAVSQINSSELLGKSKINLTIGDSATSPTQGANLADGAVGKGYAVVIGSPSSGVAVAEAPILARA